MKQNRFPKGWDEGRVKRVLDHYENQTDDEAVAEDEAAWEDTTQTFIEVPNELVPAVRELLAKKVPNLKPQYVAENLSAVYLSTIAY